MWQVIRTGHAAQLLCAVALGSGGLLPALASNAVDLGVVGPVYAIAEPSFLDEIHARLAKAQRDGSLKRLQNEARDRATARLLDPPALVGIGLARAARTHWYDPSVVFDTPVVDAEGKVIVAAGERRNPLDVVSYARTLVFFDGRDPRQVDYVRQRMEATPERIKPIVTGGSALRLMREWKRPVYADQDGRLVRQLGITEVPAVVYQDGKKFRIDTVPVEGPASRSLNPFDLCDFFATRLWLAVSRDPVRRADIAAQREERHFLRLEPGYGVDEAVSFALFLFRRGIEASAMLLFVFGVAFAAVNDFDARKAVAMLLGAPPQVYASISAAPAVNPHGEDNVPSMSSQTARDPLSAPIARQTTSAALDAAAIEAAVSVFVHALRLGWAAIFFGLLLVAPWESPVARDAEQIVRRAHRALRTDGDAA